MSPTLAHRLARLATIASALISLGTVVLVVLLILPGPAWSPPQCRLNPVAFLAREPDARSGLNELAVIWQRDLRQPLFDPAAPKLPASVPEPDLKIQLVGTAIEADRQYGLFRLSDNRTTVRPVGDEVEGYEIVAIHRGRVRLRHGEREVELTVPWYDRIRETEDGDGY